MSTTIIIQQEDAIHLITDAGYYHPDGTLVEIRSKVLTLPCGAVMSWRGYGGDWPNMFYRRLYDVPTFEQVLHEVEYIAAYVYGRLVQDGLDPARDGHFELTLAGYANSLDRLVCVQLASEASEPGGKPWFRPEAIPQFALVQASALAVQPSIDIEQALGMSMDEIVQALTRDDIHPEREGLAMIEAQRSDRGKYVGVQFGIAGGFAELSTVTRAGVMRRKLRVWPDEVGKPAGANGNDPVPQMPKATTGLMAVTR